VIDEHSVDLFVSGAYGHTRLGEWILGGMTQNLLTQSPAFALMNIAAHAPRAGSLASI